MLPDANVVHATAAEALTTSEPIELEGTDASHSKVGEDGAFANIDFAAYYFDGCGGFEPHIIGMISAALLRTNDDSSKPIAVGYSLLGGNKDVVGKELAISQAMTTKLHEGEE